MAGCEDLSKEQVAILKRFIENYDKGLRLCKCDIERVLELSGDTKKAEYRTVGPSEYVIPLQQPLIRMTCMDCGHKERSKFARIRSCPECNGVLVDAWEKDILNKVLENAGYVRVKDMNVNDVLSMAMKEIDKATTFRAVTPFSVKG